MLKVPLNPKQTNKQTRMQQGLLESNQVQIAFWLAVSSSAESKKLHENCLTNSTVFVIYLLRASDVMQSMYLLLLVQDVI